MNHLKQYSEFSINESLSRDQRILLYSVPIIIGAIGRKMGIITLLGFRWNEIKRKTKESKFDPIMARNQSSVHTIEDIKEITIKDLPSNRLGFSNFFNNWRIYLMTEKRNVTRPVVYISKEDLKSGDRYIGERINDEDVYSEFKKSKDHGYIKPENINDYPIVIMAAKADLAKSAKESEDYLDDIFLDLVDDYPVSVENWISEIGDSSGVTIKVDKGYSLEYTKDFAKKIDYFAKSAASYLSQTFGGKFKYKISYHIDGEVNYGGNSGRFDEIRQILKIDDREWDRYAWEDNSYIDREGNIKLHRIEREVYLRLNSDRGKLKKGAHRVNLEEEDMNNLLDDLGSCDPPLDKIDLKKIHIRLDK